MTMKWFRRNAVGPPEGECEAMGFVVWVKCATSAECKTIRIAVSMVKDSWVTALGLRPLVYKPSVCVDKNDLGQVKGLDMIEMGWCPL